MNKQTVLEALSNTMRFKGYSHRTERSYKSWIIRYIDFCVHHPSGSSQDKVKGFLTHLVRDLNNSHST